MKSAIAHRLTFYALAASLGVQGLLLLLAHPVKAEEATVPAGGRSGSPAPEVTDPTRPEHTPEREPKSHEPASDPNELVMQRLQAELERLYEQQRPGRALLEGPHLLTYMREIYEPTMMVVRHQMYHWDPDHIRLELRVLEGQGRDSVSLLNGKTGAIWVEGQSSPVSAEELKARLGTYRLPSLLKLQLEISEQLRALRAQNAAEYLGTTTESDGSTCHRVLGRPSDSATGTVEFVIEDQNGRLRRLIYERSGGRSEFRFSDFRTGLPEFTMPFRIEYRVDGVLRDAVRVNRLEVLQRSPSVGDVNMLEKR